MRSSRKYIKGATLSFLVLIAVLFNISTVIGAIEGNGSSYPGGSVGTCGGKNCIWDGRVGIRFSLVDKDGKKVSGTRHIDLWVLNDAYMSFVKQYWLTDSTGKTLWDFTGAFYGSQIKQDVFSQPQGLISGDYFSLSHVYDISTVIPEGNFSSNYSNYYWKPEWAEVVAKFLKDNTSTESVAIMNRLLSYMNYKDGASEAASMEYFLQYEPIIYNGRIGSSIRNYIFIGTPTEYAKYDESKAGAKSPWFYRGSTGVFIEKDIAPSNFTIGTGKDVDKLLSTKDGKIIGEGVAHIWLRDLIETDIGCEEAIEYINDTYQPNTDSYHNAVSKVKNGTFSYKKNGKIVKIKQSYSYDYLERKVYEKKGGIAACRDLDTCETYMGYDVSIDDCTTGRTYFKDIVDTEAWLKCELSYVDDNGKTYSSNNTGHASIETLNGGVVGNKEYCEVFCYEEVELSFPTSVLGVKAGQTFKWGDTNGVFGTVKIKKKCSTQDYIKGQQGYRYDEWKDDYKDNAKKMIKYSLNKQAYEKAVDTIYIETSGCNGSECTAIAKTKDTEVNYKHSFVNTVTSNIGVESATGKGTTKAKAEEDAKKVLKEILETKAQEEYAKYTGKALTSQNLLNKIKQCTNNLKYVYDTDIRFTFTEPVNNVYGANTRSFSFDGNLDVTGSFNKDNVQIDSKNCTKETVYTYELDSANSKLIAKPQQVWNCKKVTWNLSGEYTYQYPDNKFTWFSLKTNGELVNKEVKGSESEAFFYSVGFGLPTAFSLPNGLYGLNVTVSTLGDKVVEDGGTLTPEQQYNSPHGHFAYLANPVNTINGSGYGFDYSCVYEVENEIFGYDCQYDEEGNLLPESPAYCDEKEDDNPDGSLVGIDISYRLVTLLSDGDSINKAFPGKDGDGREPGGNWDISEESLYDILDANVYNTDQAMYEIMLDVNAIQKIRQDNETYFEAGKDPYTSYVDANNEKKVYCATGDGQQKYCASDFISELNLGSGLNYRLLGTCLPEENKGTLERAKYILENGCDAYYDYPTISWAR